MAVSTVITNWSRAFHFSLFISQSAGVLRVRKRWEAHGTASLGASGTNPAAVTSFPCLVQKVFETGVDVEVVIVGKGFHTFNPLVAASVLVPHHFLLHPRVGDAVAVGAAGVISLLAYKRLVAEVRPLNGWKVGAAPFAALTPPFGGGAGGGASGHEVAGHALHGVG